MKLRAKVGDREFEAEGDESFVAAQFADFLNEIKANLDARQRRYQSRMSALELLVPEEIRLVRKLEFVRRQIAEA